MKALTIWQPHAWAIIYAGKDIENRNWWPFKYRGPLLIHAGAHRDRADYDAARSWLFGRGAVAPLRNSADYGGVIGRVELVDVVQRHDSPWFEGKYGLVLANPEPLPFTPWRGAQGLFDIPEEALAASTDGPLFERKDT